MPEQRDRDAFLAQVAAGLDLPEALARDVLEELASHLDDAAADLRTDGLAAEDADRRAFGRLGDPLVLGRGLARARHGRRQLLAAAGGGIRAVLVEGIRTYLFLGLTFVLAMMFAIPASSILHLAGTLTSSYFGGPLGSGVTVLAVLSGFAYLGWVLPARIATPAVRSVRGVRRPVAALGFAIGSAVVWLLVPLTLDPVLAVGLPLGPVAFAAAALRAPERPTFRVGFVSAVLLAALLVVPLVLAALATATEPLHWAADFSAIGSAPGPEDVENTSVGSSFRYDAAGDLTVQVGFGDAAPVIAARYPTLRVEVWPAVKGPESEWIVFGSAPLIVAGDPTWPDNTFDIVMPRLRDPVTTATFVVGVAPDGRRLVLASDISLASTPPWTGTIADWWLGR